MKSEKDFAQLYSDAISENKVLRDLLNVLLEHKPSLVDDETYVALDGWKDDVRAALGRMVAVQKSSRRIRMHNVNDCKFCKQMRDEGRSFYPSHDASPNCQSGKRAHCSCDICF